MGAGNGREFTALADTIVDYRISGLIERRQVAHVTPETAAAMRDVADRTHAVPARQATVRYALSVVAIGAILCGSVELVRRGLLPADWLGYLLALGLTAVALGPVANEISRRLKPPSLTP